MFNAVFTIFVCTFILALGMGVLAFVLFDRLLRMCFLQHRSEWEKCGRPVGFFWVPQEVEVERVGAARTTVFTNWTFRVPSWIGDNQEARLAYRRFKKVKSISTIVNVLIVVEVVTLLVLVFTDIAN